MAIAGKSGKLALGAENPATVVGIKNWSIDLSLDTLETTALGEDWKSYIAGLKEWTASADGDFNVHTDQAGQAALQEAYLNGTIVDVQFYVDGTLLLQPRKIPSRAKKHGPGSIPKPCLILFFIS